MDRPLETAKVLGSTSVAFVALWAVDMPDGYLGGRDQLTQFGQFYAVALWALTVAATASIWRFPGWSRGLAASLVAINIGVFVPAVTADPVLASLVSVWQMAHLGQILFPRGIELFGHAPRFFEKGEAKLDQWFERLGVAVQHLSIVSLVTTIAVVGYEQSGSVVVYTLCLALNVAVYAVSWRYVWLSIRHRSKLYGLIWLPGAVGFAFIFDPTLALSIFAISQLVILASLLTRGPLFGELLTTFYDRPAVLIVSTFVIIILLGTMFLTFPASSAGAEPVQPVDALFTATSATCVTGLIVLDTPVDWSLFGQIVILLLIQIGGLGIMTLSTFAMLALGNTLGLRGEQALGEMLERGNTKSAYELTKFIVLSTFVIEGIGAIGLAAMYYFRYGYDLLQSVWHGVFHAISAFCNAGFALQSDSVVMFDKDPLALVWLSLLITLGGIGFAVLAAFWRRIRGEETRRASVQTRLVLWVSGVLVVAAWALFLAVEWDASLAGMSVIDRIANAFFQSVTLRTAGFNSVDFGALEMATVLMMLLFMFVGASPGSTGGGIKTTTAAVLLFGLTTIARGETRIRFFGRSLSQTTVYRSAAIAVVSSMVVFVGLFVLLLVEDIPLYSLAFETVSAVATVGLSLGATSDLGAVGKFIIIAIMFVGRVGPLTLALLLTVGEPSPVEYPEADVMVG